MEVTRLYLVRHGETDWNAVRRVQGQKESQLNELGLKQAADRAAEIDALNVHAVYCSSSERTRQTVQGLLAGCVEEVQYQDNLREMCMGVWEGHLRSDIEKTHPEQTEYFFNRPDKFELEGSETFAELQHRGVRAMTEIAHSHKGQRVLVVSHGAIIKASLLNWLNWPMAQMWVEPLIGNCSVSVVEFDDEHGARVLRVGDVDL